MRPLELLATVALLSLPPGGNPPQGAGTDLNTLPALRAVVADRVMTVPSFPGGTALEYASSPKPHGLSFDRATGVLYAGRDEDLPVSDPYPIHWIAPGGGPGKDYGAPVKDPDGVAFDAVGALSGRAGSVLISEGLLGYQGMLQAIWPDQTTVTVLGPTSELRNPNKIVFEAGGSLLILDDRDTDGGRVYRWTGGALSTVFAGTPRPSSIAVDADGRIYTSWHDGHIQINDSDGTLLDGDLITGLGGPNVPIAIGPGGPWGTDFYTIDMNTGQLLRVDTAGTRTVVGSDFTGVLPDMTFGPDTALYVSDRDNDRILRVSYGPPPPNRSPLPFGFPAGLRDTVDVGFPITLDTEFWSPELGQATATSVDVSQLPGASLSNTPGNPSTQRLDWLPDPSQIGAHEVSYTAVDDGSPPKTTGVILTLVVRAGPPVPSGFPLDGRDTVCVGRTYSINTEFSSVKPWVTVTTTVDVSQLPGAVVASVPGNPSTQSLSWTPSASDQGAHVARYVAKDNGSPHEQTVVDLALLAQDCRVSLAYSTVPCIRLCPTGGFPTTVVVRDTLGNPLPNVSVRISFAACDSVTFCRSDAGQGYEFELGRYVVSKLTDGAGRAAFALRGGGISYTSVAAVTSGEVLLAWRSVASDDQNASLAVGAADAAEFSRKLGLGVYDRTVDLNCDEFLNLSDFALFTSHSGHSCETGVGVPTSSSATGPALLPALPNPLRTDALLTFDLPGSARVTLRLHDVAGRTVRLALAEAALLAGRHSWRWDGLDDHGTAVTPGIYFAVLEVEGRRAAQRMVVLR